MAEQYGYTGKILKIDLTNRQVTEIQSSDYLPKYFGGRSLAAKLYWDEMPPEVGALDPESALIFTTGPLTGTGASMASVSQCAGKAPALYPSQTYHCCSAAGGWGHAMKYAGYDAFIIKGKAEKPVYLWINDDKIEIMDAGSLWGQGTRQTRFELFKIHGDETQVACIGPAGENLVIPSVITVDSSTAYGMGGFGALMGSKNLKAIAVLGTGVVQAADPVKLAEINEVLRRVESIRDGEARTINGNEIVGSVDPKTTLFQRDPARAELIESALGKARVRRAACPGCVIGCKSKREYTDGSLPTGSAECGELQMWTEQEKAYYNDELPFGRVSWQWTMLVDDMGLDALHVGCANRGYPVKIETTSHGATSIGLDMWRVAYEKGILTEENTGLPWSKFGSQEFLEKYIYMFTYRQGFGDILARGTGPAVEYIMAHEEFGPNRGELEYMYQKEYPKAGVFGGTLRHTLFHGYGYGSAAPATTFYTAVGSRRGRKPLCYGIDYPSLQYALMGNYPDDFSAVYGEWQKKVYGTNKGLDHSYWGEELVQAVIRQEYYANECDSAPRCAFTGMSFGNEEMSTIMQYSQYFAEEYLSAILGEEINQEKLFLMDERNINMERAIWVRDGYTDGAVDTFNDVIFEETDGEGNILIPKDKLESALEIYYQLRGWKAGVPTRAKLEELELKDVADELEALGKLPV